MTDLSTSELMSRYVAPNYGRFPLTISRGKGAYVWDEDGKKYLDFGTGIAVCPLGHSHPVITETLHRQAQTLIHCSNLYQIREQALLARHIVEQLIGQAGRVFFCNSGAEANETLIKLARKFGHDHPGADGQPRFEVITFDGSFHGRTLAGIAATGQAKVKSGFAPLPAGFKHVPYNDLEALKAAVTPQTAAILLEAVQGEGGIHPASPEFLRGAADLCKEGNLLLMFDEVQCGLGRTGHLCGWRSISGGEQILPHAVSWAKGLGGGLPIGAVWMREDISNVLGPGTHGSTFGGNPLVSAVSRAVLEEIQEQRLWENAAAIGQDLRQTIKSWQSPLIREVRGLGAMIGIVLDQEKISREAGVAASIHVVKRLMEAGLLAIPAGPDVVRLLPSLNVTGDEAGAALEIIQETLTGIT